MAPYGVEMDGTILHLSIFSANWEGAKGQRAALREVSGASLPLCSSKDDSVRPEIIYPSSDSNDIYHVGSHTGGIRL